MSSSQLVDSCLLVNRKVEETKEKTICLTEFMESRVLQEKGYDLPQYSGDCDTQQMTSYSVDTSYHSGNVLTTNGHPEDSPASQSSHPEPQLVSRTQKQQTTQQVTKVTKVIREIRHIGPDGQPIDYAAYGIIPAYNVGNQYPGYEDGIHPGEESYRAPSPTSDTGSRTNYHPYRTTYQDYDQYPNRADYAFPPYASYPDYDPRSFPETGEYRDRPPTPPSPSERSESPPPASRAQETPYGTARKGANYPPSGYTELDSTLIPQAQQFMGVGTPDVGPERYDYEKSTSYEEEPRYAARHGHNAPRAIFDEDENAEPQQVHGPPPYVSPKQSPSPDQEGRVRWRDPDLHEVIEFLNHPNNIVRANAAAYLQHLCYMDNPMKQKTRALGGIPPLVALLGHDIPEVHRNACGALRNLSYGRENDENKKAIKNAGGIPALVRSLRKTVDNEIKELVTGILWNLSSCEAIKRPIIDDALQVLVSLIIIPHSGWDKGNPNDDRSHDIYWSTVFRNASGVLRNVSSAGEYARKKLRECEGLVDALLYLVKAAIGKSNIDNKSVENCVCILRNLSYRCQEVEDPNYDKFPIGTPTRAEAQVKGDNLGCFGASKKKKDAHISQNNQVSGRIGGQRSEPIAGMELLWQPEVVQPYLSLLSDCSNPETLEAAAGAIQNLAACYWQPSIDIRAAVRKEKGLPILVELLRMEVDRVVCAVATALRNLAIDQRNKELIGKYAMRDLVNKLPSGSAQHDQGTSDSTIAAVLATLNEVIKKSAEFSRSLYEAGGVDRLIGITRQRQRYSSRVMKFASQVLYTMWQHQELRDVYKRGGWKEGDFVTRTVAARNARPNSPMGGNSTLNRPMASQGGTRYEDRTLQRGNNVGNNVARSPGYRSGEDVPLADYPDTAHVPTGGVRMYPPPPYKPGEPVYAQVNRDKKKNRYYDGIPTEPWGSSDHHPRGATIDSANDQPAGDSWV